MNRPIILTDTEKLQISLVVLRNVIKKEGMRFDKANINRRLNEISKQSGVPVERCRAFTRDMYLEALEEAFS